MSNVVVQQLVQRHKVAVCVGIAHGGAYRALDANLSCGILLGNRRVHLIVKYHVRAVIFVIQVEDRGFEVDRPRKFELEPQEHQQFGGQRFYVVSPLFEKIFVQLVSAQKCVVVVAIAHVESPLTNFMNI